MKQRFIGMCVFAGMEVTRFIEKGGYWDIKQTKVKSDFD